MDQDMNFTQNIDALFSNLEEFTRNESVMGKPVSFEGKTLIPVISVTVGYGSGNTPQKGQQGQQGQQGNNPVSAAAGMMQGMGALGLGARVSTDAVVLIENNNVSVLPIAGKASTMMDKIPQMLSGMNMGGQQQGQGQNQQQNQQGQQ